VLAEFDRMAAAGLSLTQPLVEGEKLHLDAEPAARTRSTSPRPVTGITLLQTTTSPANGPERMKVITPDGRSAETTLQGLLEGLKQYQVPLYQRTYSWTEHQLERLWEDILRLAEDRVDNPTATHFIGSLVLAPSPKNGPSGVQDFLVSGRSAAADYPVHPALRDP